jgi:ATP-dependent helicase/nuclease subunit A
VVDTQSNPPPADRVYRDRITEDLDTTMLVEAAAGTGKTTCLVARMVGLLRAGKCRIETLAAVTFTRKAAAELRTRFQLKLEEESRQAEGSERERLQEAVAQVERCVIGTIHSFCARMLRERPVEAGVNPGFVELDDILDAQLRQQAWREHVASLITTNDPILPELQTLGLNLSSATRRSNSVVDELDELGLEPAELGPAFLELAEFADVDDWPAKPVPLPDLEPCRAELRDYVAHMRSLDFPDERGNDKLMSSYEDICRRATLLDLQKPVQLMELLEQFDSSPKVIQKMWPGKKAQAVPEKSRWDGFRQQFAAPLLQAWREHRYEPVMRAIRPARDVYDRLRADRNALNFQDLLLLTVKLLRDQSTVRRYFRERFTHLLVDEFQDTDPLQAEIMLLLTADDITERDWLKCRPAAGSLFVVGDPKQSIYRFRRADILTYSRVRSIIEDVGGQVVPLTANFRSARPVIEWINACFSTLFPAQANDQSPADRPLDVGRLDDVSDDSGVQRLLIPGSVRRNDDAAEYEADQIARFIRRAVDEEWPVPRSESDRQHGLPDHAQPGDFLLVTKSKSRLSIYARKLQQYGLPHVVTGGGVLNSVPELELLSLCVTSVARHDDPVALVAVLRSELFGIADTTLYEFRRHGGRFSYFSDIPDQLTGDEADQIADAFERLQLYASWLRQMPAAAAIEKVASHLGLVARACAVEEGDAHAGSLLKAIEVLRASESGLTVGDSIDRLARLAEGAENHDGMPVRSSSDLPVRVMNLHQCKGLEAPFVFLVDPSGERSHDVEIHIDRAADHPRGYVAIYGRKRNQWKKGAPPLLAQPPGWDQLAQDEQRFLDAETHRLLYVAATRAGHRLVISQRDGNGNSTNPWQTLNSHLESQSDFQDLGAVTSPERAASTINSDSWLQEVEAIEKRWQVAIQPSYSIQGIKESAIQAGPKPHGAEKDGAEWGQVIHTLLETAMKHPGVDLHGVALSALEAEELSLDLTDQVVATVQQVLVSDIWQRAQNAERCLTEVPLAMPVQAEQLPTVRRGVIDLIFKGPAGWVIVDYKSERVDSEAIPALVSYYEPQVRAYIEAWKTIVGERIAEAGLFFTHPGRFVIVENKAP